MSKLKPRISLIIATHSRPDLLPRAIASGHASGGDVEIIVVDDASSDETAGVCRGISDIRYVRLERNQGVAGARNVGLVVSSGEFISFLDDDDVRLPGSLDIQVQTLEQDPQAGMIYGQAFLTEKDGASESFYPTQCPQGDIFWQLLNRNFIPCGTVVFRRACLARVGLLDDSIPGLDDWDLWVRIAEIYRIIAVATPVIKWRQSTPGSGQGTSRASVLVAKSVRQFRDCWMKLPRALEASSRTKRAAWRQFSENMAEHLIWESVRAVGCRNLSQAFRNLSTIPKLHPLALMSVAEHRVLRIPRKPAPEFSPHSASGCG